MINVEPDYTVAIPTQIMHEDPVDLHARAAAAFRTTQFLMESGLESIYISPEDVANARHDFFDAKKTPVSDQTPGKALMLKALLSEYDLDMVRSAVQLRNYVKLRLLELSSCGRESTELRALELLGKLADVNAFSENVNVTIEHKTTKELEVELATRLSAYIEGIEDAEIIPPTPPEPIKPIKLPSANEALGWV